MNALQERILRACLKPAVECDLPGRLRLRFAKADRLPEQALPYLHYIPEVMQLLPGVGEVLAQRIMDMRNECGGFAYPEDLLLVKGIGTKKLEALRPLICFK